MEDKNEFNLGKNKTINKNKSKENKLKCNIRKGRGCYGEYFTLENSNM